MTGAIFLKMCFLFIYWQENCPLRVLMYFKDFDKCRSSEPAAVSFPKNMKNRPETESAEQCSSW